MAKTKAAELSVDAAKDVKFASKISKSETGEVLVAEQSVSEVGIAYN